MSQPTTVNRSFEFVLLRADALQRPADADAFREHYTNDTSVVTFSNLRGDAAMVAPCPVESCGLYAHLGEFIRNAPNDQAEELWQAVGEAMAQRLSNKPVWLSTAGMGVAWLHVRLDSRPKYYGHKPYKTA